MERFRDRQDAGRQLAEALHEYADARPIVLGLPRGGVPVGFEVARQLGAPLDVWVVRKVGVPWNPELGAGAVSEGGQLYLSRQVMAGAGVGREQLEPTIAKKRREVDERVRRFRRGGPAPELAGRTVIVVDDGVATGGTVRAALRSIRERSPATVILAIPVAPADALAGLSAEVDDIVVLQTPEALWAIGQAYQDFAQVF